MIYNEEEMIKKMNENMECNRYNMSCLDVPYEVLEYVSGLGFSAYECNLDCKNCGYMEE